MQLNLLSGAARAILRSLCLSFARSFRNSSLSCSSSSFSENQTRSAMLHRRCSMLTHHKHIPAEHSANARMISLPRPSPQNLWINHLAATLTKTNYHRRLQTSRYAKPIGCKCSRLTNNMIFWQLFSVHYKYVNGFKYIWNSPGSILSLYFNRNTINTLIF